MLEKQTYHVRSVDVALIVKQSRVKVSRLLSNELRVKLDYVIQSFSLLHIAAAYLILGGCVAVGDISPNSMD